MFSLNLLVSLTSAFAVIEAGHVELSATTPVFYKSNVTINGNLIGAEYQTYEWFFRAELPDGHVYTKYVSRISPHVQITEVFDIPMTKDIEEINLEVRVTYRSFIFPRTFGKNTTKIVLTNSIPITVNFEQNGTNIHSVDRNSENVLVVSSMQPTNATVTVHDDGDYFSSLKIRFSIYWKLNREVGIYNSSLTNVYPTQVNGTNDVLEVVVAPLQDIDTIAPARRKIFIQGKKPVLSLNVSGETWVRRGQLTRLNFNCDASLPIYYCYATIVHPAPNVTDFNCTEKDYHRSTHCEFQVIRYFSSVGDHGVWVKVRNVLNGILPMEPLTKMYTVRVYDVANVGNLHLFIVPISCFIIGVIVVVSSVAFYKHTKEDYRVEVADFDFGGTATCQEEDAVLEERTFWSHIRDELADSHKMLAFLARERSTTNLNPRAAGTAREQINDEVGDSNDDEPQTIQRSSRDRPKSS